MGVIYCATNTWNGKQYIGQTIFPLEERKQKHFSSAKHSSNLTFHKALRKYGFNNFQWDILEECPEELLNEKEQYWISKLDTYKNGYNETIGGDGVRKYSLKKYQKIIEELDVNNLTIKKLHELKGYSYDLIRSAIKACNYDYAERIGGSSKKVINYYNKTKSIKDTAKYYKVEQQTIANFLLKHSVKIWNRQFRPSQQEEKDICDLYSNGSSVKDICKKYSCSEDLIYRILNQYSIKLKSKTKTVYQINISTKEIINIFSSMKEAKEKTGASDISKAAKDFPNKQSGGFLWMKEEDYDNFWHNGLPSW